MGTGLRSVLTACVLTGFAGTLPHAVATDRAAHVRGRLAPRTAPAVRTAGRHLLRRRIIRLACADSVGQQGGGAERAVNGVDGLILPGSSDPASLSPIVGPRRRGFVYKAMLAVSSTDSPGVTVSVLGPSTASLVYGSATHIGQLAGHRGRGLAAASSRAVWLPTCGDRYTAFVGGIVVRAASCVEIAVTAPGRSARIRVPVGTRCRTVHGS